uniref:Phospholipase A1 member A n=1 Tax=Cacopsylla melanoneura TaxID=428564 RepID=A0A8D8Z894_9HEMI
MLIGLLTCAVISFQGVQSQRIIEALNLGGNNPNVSRDDCIWKRERVCPDPDIGFHMYTNHGGKIVRDEVNTRYPAWIHSSLYDNTKPSVILIHGYGGVRSDYLPVAVLRDAYLKTGQHNVFLVDWSPLAATPCYASAVHNMRSVARCTAHFMEFLRMSGVPTEQTTCVGHSLGAHVCGVTSNFLNFRMSKIIGLDPARPLIRNNLKARLDPGDATLVQVLHTSSVFGDPKRMGTVDVCVNGGRSQPFCASAANDQLCSHIRSVCFLAQSLFHHKAQVATPCSRRCSNYGGRVRQPLTRNENSIVIGQFMPENAEGTYCISDPNPPYCSMQGDGNHGSPFCCVPYSHDGALNEISNGFTDQ